MCHHVFMYDIRDKNTNSQTNGSIITTEKRVFAEGRDLCRVSDHGHSAKMWFAECQASGTRQKNGTRHVRDLPSAGRRQITAIGNASPLPSASQAALGKACARAQHARLPCATRQWG